MLSLTALEREVNILYRLFGGDWLKVAQVFHRSILPNLSNPEQHEALMFLENEYPELKACLHFLGYFMAKNAA